MKKNALMLIFTFLFVSLNAQDKYMTRSGNLSFEASVPTFDEVEADNKNVTALLNIKTGDFATLALVKAFKFKIALMEEHFNENYLESDDFPKATFKGQFENFDMAKLNEGEQKHVLNGELTIHGQTKKIKLYPMLSIKDGKITMNTSFKINLEDYGVEIPSIVKGQIAEDVHTVLNFELTAKI